MTIYFVHTGTNTIIDAMDGVFVLDTATLTADELAVLDDDADSDIGELAILKGKPYIHTDLTWRNCVAYSPSSIREEIRESLWEGYADNDKDRAVLEWAENASDDDLNAVASYILSADDVWQNFTLNLVEGLREGYRRAKEAK